MKSNMIDFADKNQTLNFYQWLRTNPSGSEFIGICKGIVADGIITQSESNFFKKCLAESSIRESSIGGLLIARLEEYADSSLTSLEGREELKCILKNLSKAKVLSFPEIFNSKLPLNDNEQIIYKQNKFCITGKCLFATRDRCQKILQSQSAIFSNNVSTDTHALIVGTFRSTSWAKGTDGKKITKAKELINEGNQIKIISELRWLNDIYEQ